MVTVGLPAKDQHKDGKLDMYESRNAEESVSQIEHPNKLVPQLFSEIDESTTQLSTLIDSLIGQVKSRKLDASDGISLLDVKNQLMGSYLTNIVYIIAKKCQGKSIEGEAAVDRLVEIRTVLERIRPVEYKLKYMVEKLVKAALTGVTDGKDPTNFRANPEDMMDESGSETEEEESVTRKKNEKKSGVYVPPKLAPVYYDEEETAASRRQKLVERAKKRALHSSVVEELKEQYLDTPTELSHGNTLRTNVSRHQRHKAQYEEEYFTRLTMPKKDKHRSRHSMTVGNIGDQLTQFENIDILEDESSFAQRPKRKNSSVGKSAKKKGFKKRKKIH